MLSKISKMKSILLALSILLPLAISSFPITLNPPLVKAESAAITLNVSQGYVGDYVTVTGRGFSPNKDVTFMWGDQLFSSLGFISGMPRYQRPTIAPSTGEAHTDALGNFIVQLQVPKQTSGTYTIKADDTTTAATVEFTINPKLVVRNEYAYKKHGTSQTPSQTKSNAYYIELFLAEGFVGDYLAFQLSGFGEGEIVEVNMSSTTKLDDFTVGNGDQRGYGFWTSAERVPEITGADYTITATGKVSGITASSSFRVKPELFLSSPPPSTPDLSNWPWVYAFSNFGLSWYSSVNASANAVFYFEATGLTGTNVSGVSVVYSGGTSMTCGVTGTTTVSGGSTQGINLGTVPFAGNSPFTDGLSPKVTIPSAIPSGKMVSVTITTGGTGGASFTFTNQLFSSTPGANETDGTLMWLEGESTISSGTSLSGNVNDRNKLVATGCYPTGWPQWPSAVPSTGSTVSKLDMDVGWGWSLTAYSSATPVSFYDVNSNSLWDSTEPVYIDNDNSATVTTGDQRVTLQRMGGQLYFPMDSVAGSDPDLGRTLVEFPPETRPSYHMEYWFTWVYLDKYNQGYVSEGDTRITEVPLWIWWTMPTSDSNGFVAYTLGVPSIPGAGRTYDIGLFDYWIGSSGVILDNKVTMEVLAGLEVYSAPTAYQSTYYVTEGSDNIYIEGTGFLGSEQLKISVGGKYMKTVTPDAYGYFTTDIDDMPALTGGAQTISAVGVTTSDNTASTTITYTPILSVSPTTGYNLNPVTSIAVTGKGFAAGTYEIVLDGAGIGQAVTSCTVADAGDEAGRINAAFNLPDSVEGSHIVDVVNTSNSSAFYGLSYFDISANNRPNTPLPTNTEFPTVAIYPSLERTPTTTTVGSLITIEGKGLQPSKTYYIWYDPRGTSTTQARLILDPESVETDANGTLTATSFHIPESSGGTRNIWVSTSNIAINNDPMLGSPVSTSVYIRPIICLSQYSGVVGTSVDVTFGGLSANSQYQLWWYKPEEAPIDGYEGTPLIPATAVPLATATGDQFGNSTENISFTVPATAENGAVYTIDLSYYGAYNRYSELANPVFFTVGKVASTITLSLTPATVTEGESVAINGVIQPALAVDITIYITPPNGTSTTITVTSSSSGTFTETFTPNAAGTWQVTAQWNGDATYAAYQSLAATVTVKPVDITWTYAVAGIAIGLIALIVGLLVIVYYFLYKRKPAATTAPK
jgi:hypothetical protein